MKRLLVVFMLGVLAAGCDKMDSQPKYTEYKPAPLFRDNRTLQEPPQGTVARDDAPAQATSRPPLTKALLARGRERFDIFCAPCHSRTGDGHGMLVSRGMPQPPDYADERLRAAPDQHFYDVISKGYGVMYSYASRIPEADRWAIVAYIRALQLSRHAVLDDVPQAERAHLTGGGGG
ncbi:MAG TPA: cytochrome c [Pseudolabrys sp.]|nr:cytochrome c [Pseudolabrys sp.]